MAEWKFVVNSPSALQIDVEVEQNIITSQKNELNEQSNYLLI